MLHRLSRVEFLGCTGSTGFNPKLWRSNSTGTAEVGNAQKGAYIRGESAPTVHVGMSGGVDSTVSALLLKEQVSAKLFLKVPSKECRLTRPKRV